MYFVYALKSIQHNYIYVGMTSNLELRVNRHSSKRKKTTRTYAPFELLYTENLDSRPQARAREKYLKSGTGKEFLKSIK